MSSNRTVSSNATADPTLVNDTGIPFVYPPAILATATVLVVLSILAVSARFWSRRWSGQGIKADDWTILAALPLTIAMIAMMIYGVAEQAVGYPSQPFPIPKSSFAEEELTEETPKGTIVYIVYWATWMLLIPANGLIKLSAILMYRRVFVVFKGTAFDIITRVAFVVCLIWTVGFFLAQLFGCRLAFYKPFTTEENVASCNTNVRLNALMISDLITDILVWMMPIPPVWRLKMRMRRKFSVTGVLLLATISIVAASIRLKVELGISSGGYSIFVDGDQILTVNIFWSNIESSLALIAACLPTLNLNMIQHKAASTRKLLSSLFSTQRADSVDTHCDDHSSTDEFVSSEKVHKTNVAGRDASSLESSNEVLVA